MCFRHIEFVRDSIYILCIVIAVGHIEVVIDSSYIRYVVICVRNIEVVMLVSHCGEYMANGLTDAIRHQFPNDSKVIT